MNKFCQISILLFVAGLLNACGASNMTTIETPTQNYLATNGCILPIVTSSYPVGDIVSPPPVMPDILPTNWGVISDIPNTIPKQGIPVQLSETVTPAMVRDLPGTFGREVRRLIDKHEYELVGQWLLPTK